MDKTTIINKVKNLNLPENSYVVFGSCPLAIEGIRESNDIDLLVSGELHKILESKGWQKIVKGPHDTPVVRDVFEAHDNWNFSSYNPTLADLLINAKDVDGVKFASIDDVRRWKLASSRPKDLADLKLIDAYLTDHVKESV